MSFDQNKLPQKWFASDYSKMLESLLPDGFIWIFEKFSFAQYVQDVISTSIQWDDSAASTTVVQDVIDAVGGTGNILRRLLSCFALEFERLESAAWNVLNQTDPGVADEFLTDWERVLGLPEECYANVSTTVAERQQAAHAKLFSTGVVTTESYFVELAATLGFTVTVQTTSGTSVPRRMGVARMGVERMGGSSGNSVLQVTVISGTGNLDVLQCAFDRVKQAHTVIEWIL